MSESEEEKKPNVAGGLVIVALCVGLAIWMMAKDPFGGTLSESVMVGLVFAALFAIYYGVRLMGADRLLSGIAAFFLFSGGIHAGDLMSQDGCTGAHGGGEECEDPLPEPEIATVDGKSDGGAGAGKTDLARPVRVGVAGSDFGRCEAIGRVGNLPGGEDNFLVVRAGPTVRAREVARLDPDARVYLCDQTANDAWLGVVYRANGSLPDGDSCALQAADNRIYGGPCRSGWVSAGYVMREHYVVEGSGDAVASQSARDGIVPSNASAPESEPAHTVSYYFCDITEGLSRDIFERRRTQGIERGYYLSPVFSSEPGRRESLAETYRQYALRTQDYDLGAKLGAPTCYEFSDIAEANTVREEHRRDYDASSKFETIENFWRGQ